MALRLRRGTDAERALITPVEGELVWTTDTKELYAGDGTTVGGIKITGADDAPRTDLNELDDVTLGTINDGDVLAYDADTGVWRAFPAEAPDLIAGESYNIGIIADDSSILVDTATNFHRGNFEGDLYDNGGTRLIDADGGIIYAKDGLEMIDLNVRGGNFDLRGNIQGSVFNNDLTQILVDHDNEIFYGTLEGSVLGNVTGNVTGDIVGSVFADDSSMLLDGTDGAYFGGKIENDVNIVTNDRNDGNRPQLRLVHDKNPGDVNLNSLQGNIHFDAKLADGTTTPTAYIAGGTLGFFFVNDYNLDGSFGTENTTTINANGIGFKTYTPQEALDIDGNALFTGFVQFGSLTTAERDALTAANGMVIYNTTDNKFQGYENGAWVNLI